jgi:hypothetical protein
MKVNSILFALLFVLYLIKPVLLVAQPSVKENQITYFLPAQNYNPSILDPADYFGFAPGEWHLSFNQVSQYLKYLAEKSDRVLLQEYARSHEQRILFQLLISHPDNLNRLADIQRSHVELSLPDKAGAVDLSDLPAVIQLAYTVHGNEQSGMHAAVYMAYYLSAVQDPSVDLILRSTLVLLDPCMNPDGADRFSTWVNSKKGKNVNTDPASSEFNEPWPGSRGNHYWFDLNRDWIAAIHPESRGRIRQFHTWYPNVVCDFHEMNSNDTYFFQPGIPERTNPLTPIKNQQLTAAIAKYHAVALDDIGSLYYTKENFDDFFYGKGSTYPDIFGSVGILFEQASSRGHAQSTHRGVLTFPFTIRNQIKTSISSLKAASDMRMELLEYKRQFFADAIEAAKAENHRGWMCHFNQDMTRSAKFLEMLELHQIQVYATNKKLEVQGKSFPEGSFYIPIQQKTYRLIKSIFDTQTTFSDSIFYDISAWNKLMAFGAVYAIVPKDKGIANEEIGKIELADLVRKPQAVPFSGIGYILPWDDFAVAAVLNEMLKQGIQVQAFSESCELKTKVKTYTTQAGDLFIPARQGALYEEQINQLMQTITNQHGLRVHAIESGLAVKGKDLGSSTVRLLKPMRPVVLTGSGIAGTDAGEIWYHLDHYLNLSPTQLDPASNWSKANWSDYSHCFITGNPQMQENQIQDLRNWQKNGGIIIAYGQGLTWVKTNKFSFHSDTTLIGRGNDQQQYLPYDQMNKTRAAKQINGAIFKIQIDPSHPLFYGFTEKEVPVFVRGTSFIKTNQNKQASPAWFTKDFLLSGYIPNALGNSPENLPAVAVSSQGAGKTVCLQFNPLYRAQWAGTARIINNALFFGALIQSQTTLQQGE